MITKNFVTIYNKASLSVLKSFSAVSTVSVLKDQPQISKRFDVKNPQSGIIARAVINQNQKRYFSSDSTNTKSDNVLLSNKGIPRDRLRNIAIIAHVDHGKTTLVDCLLKDIGYGLDSERIMDSNDLEKEKGITIMAKSTAINFQNHQINLVDTPGHSDFGGEVERIMTMVDGVLLLVCATEGPMAQTKYVLRKALEAKKKPIVIINKVDRPTARVEDVENEIFDLFCDIDKDEDFIDYPVFYASGKDGWATKDMSNITSDMSSVNTSCILESIIEFIQPPNVNDQQALFSFLGSQIDYSDYFGKLIRGKVYSGSIEVGQLQNVYNQQKEQVQSGKVTKLVKNFGQKEIEIVKAMPGEIVTIAGLDKAMVNSVLLDEKIDGGSYTIKGIDIDEPLLMISCTANNSPFSGRDSDKPGIGPVRERLLKEGGLDPALRVVSESNSISVFGRGDLHLGILFEKLRREGFEFELTCPIVVTKEGPNGEELEPIEQLKMEINIEHISVIMEKLLHRKGYVLECNDLPNNRHLLVAEISSKGLIGFRNEVISLTQNTAIIETNFLKYEEVLENIIRQPKGSLVSTSEGPVTSYALKDLERLGVLFIKPGHMVYQGMLVGESGDDKDFDINVCKMKQLTNIRAAGMDEKVRLAPPRTFNIEEAISYMREEDLLEVTPKNIRMRKLHLDQSIRRKMRKDNKSKRF